MVDLGVGCTALIAIRAVLPDRHCIRNSNPKLDELVDAGLWVGLSRPESKERRRRRQRFACRQIASPPHSFARCCTRHRPALPTACHYQLSRCNTQDHACTGLVRLCRPNRMLSNLASPRHIASQSITSILLASLYTRLGVAMQL